MANKVKFGLKNVHYAMMTETTSQGVTTYSYGTPKPWPGAVNLALDAQGGLSPFYADDRKYFTTYSMAGYEGDFECALIPDSAKVDIFGDSLDSNGVLIENSAAQPNPFALLFEFDGDERAARHVLYNCTMTRPSLGSATKEEEAEVQTETATISAMPRVDNSIHASSTATTNAAAYSGWYSAVYEAAATASCLVTFNTNGGSAVDPQIVVSGGKATQPAAPTKDGKTFGGWYSDLGLTDEFNFASTTITTDTMLYAKWTS